MLRRLTPVCLGLLAIAAISFAAGDRTEKKNGPDPGAVEVRFADGSLVRMVVLQENIDVMTRYGKLTVPMSEIRRIEFAFRLPEETMQKVAALVKDLGHDLHARREEASKELVALGAAAMPALLAAAKNGDAEVVRRAQTAIAQIKEKVPAERLRFPTSDVIQTSEFPIVGRIITPSIKARTAYFGEVQLQVGDLRTVSWMTSSGEAVVVLDAAQYANPNQWLETESSISAHANLQITVTGQIDLWPQTPGQYMTGPAGYQAGRAGNQPGVVLARVGESGKVFPLGERYEGTPGQEGKLYLHIVPSPWGNVSAGTYTVKIAIRP